MTCDDLYYRLLSTIEALCHTSAGSHALARPGINAAAQRIFNERERELMNPSKRVRKKRINHLQHHRNVGDFADGEGLRAYQPDMAPQGLAYDVRL